MKDLLRASQSSYCRLEASSVRFEVNLLTTCSDDGVSNENFFPDQAVAKDISNAQDTVGTFDNSVQLQRNPDQNTRCSTDGCGPSARVGITSCVELRRSSILTDRSIQLGWPPPRPRLTPVSLTAATNVQRRWRSTHNAVMRYPIRQVHQNLQPLHAAQQHSSKTCIRSKATSRRCVDGKPPTHPG